MSKIMIIEDDEAIQKMLCLNLSVAGYQTIAFGDGQQVLDFLNQGGLAVLALVDVMLPKVDGFELLEPLKARNIPVIFLTARGDLEAKVKGLRGGAEDYMVKPFDMLELLVRMEKVLERHGALKHSFQAGDVIMDTAAREVTKAGENVTLTPMEFDLLEFLLRNQNIAVSRERLLAEVWGSLYEGTTRTVDVHIAQIRKKTGLNIASVAKVGYRLEETVK